MRRLPLLQLSLMLLGAMLANAVLPVMAQESLTGASCHPESVVLTHCDAPPPSAGVPESAAAKAAREDARKKAELAAALERQRQRSAREANGTASPDELERSEVVGQQLHTPNASEVFDSYFGNPKILAPDITQNTDQMGNRTECITQCVGPFCCKTTPANPGTPSGP